VTVAWVTGKEPAAELVGKELAAECRNTLLTLSATSGCDDAELFVPLRINDHDVPSA